MKILFTTFLANENIVYTIFGQWIYWLQSFLLNDAIFSVHTISRVI